MPSALTDPTELYRARDGIYADDLLVAAVAWLDLFTWLAGRSADLTELSDGLALTTRGADVMCTLFRAMGLLEANEAVLVPTPLAREHLVAGSPSDLRAYFASLRDRPTCRELVDVLRGGRPAGWSSSGGSAWADRLGDPAFAADITSAMDARGAYLAPALARALDDVPGARLLDIAGGSGIYAAALAWARPGMDAAILERPPVDAAARVLLAQRGHADRVRVLTGDMFESLPVGYDLHLLSHTLHDWEERSVRTILRNSFAALAPGGWLVDHDTHINADKTGPLPVARYSVLLLHSTVGKCWSVTELRGFLLDAGFEDVEVREAAGDRSIVLARKPP